ncbi:MULTISPECIES: class I ribonucleotide reductase maintenance protein YfaE [Vibrio]|uniref:class I ribonucleotide reductase maintenance protein YfaE n=1 Tax=Vibrio TaxID=662 RepID=UPI0026B31DB1
MSKYSSTPRDWSTYRLRVISAGGSPPRFPKQSEFTKRLFWKVPLVLEYVSWTSQINSKISSINHPGGACSPAGSHAPQIRSMTMHVNLPASTSTLLVQLERKGIAIESQCRNGYCGACRCKLVRGNISYRAEPIAYLNDGEILPCCATATSDVTVDI